MEDVLLLIRLLDLILKRSIRYGQKMDGQHSTHLSVSHGGGLEVVERGDSLSQLLAVC